MTTGKIVWRELYTKDPKRDRGFFGELFGWEVKDMPMGTMTYPTLSIHDQSFGALLSQDDISKSTGDGPQLTGWIPYVSSSVDEAARKAESLGGKVCVPPTDIPGGGRFAILQDPDGAAFGVHEHPNPPPMPETGMPSPGEPCWETLVTRDAKRAEAFYEGVLGWKTIASPTGGSEIVFALPDGTPVADVHATQKHAPTWSTYIAVASLEGVLGRAQRLGARVTMPRTEIPNVGSAVFMNDPTGCEVGLFQPLD